MSGDAGNSDREIIHSLFTCDKYVDPDGAYLGFHVVCRVCKAEAPIPNRITDRQLFRRQHTRSCGKRASVIEVEELARLKEMIAEE